MSFWRKLRAWLGSAVAGESARTQELDAALRSPRIRLLLADGARFETSEAAYPLLNISETGLGFACEGEAPAGILNGMLYLGEISLPVEIEIVRQAGTLVGARFTGRAVSLRATLRQIFLEELRATEMSEVSARGLPDEEGHPRWFYAAGNYELFFVEQGGRAVRLEMEWSGRVVTASLSDAPRIGHLPPDTDIRKGKAKAQEKASLVEWDEALLEEDRAKAIRILENVPGLEPERRGELVGMLRR